jgi:hypothetical protein
MWIACLLPLAQVEKQGDKVAFSYNPEELVLLLVERIQAINAFCEKISDDSTSIIESILTVQPEQVVQGIVNILTRDR